MKKIYDAYHSNKTCFYLLLCIYSEVIFAFCIGFFFSVLYAEVRPVHPELITELSPLGNVIFISIIIAGIILLITPPIWLTVKAVRDRIKVVQIFIIWVCEVAACTLAFVLVLNGWSLVGRLSELLVDFLDDKFDIFVTSISLQIIW